MGPVPRPAPGQSKGVWKRERVNCHVHSVCKAKAVPGGQQVIRSPADHPGHWSALLASASTVPGFS